VAHETDVEEITWPSSPTSSPGVAAFLDPIFVDAVGTWQRGSSIETAFRTRLNATVGNEMIAKMSNHPGIFRAHGFTHAWRTSSSKSVASGARKSCSVFARFQPLRGSGETTFDYGSARPEFKSLRAHDITRVWPAFLYVKCGWACFPLTTSCPHFKRILLDCGPKCSLCGSSRPGVFPRF
jgi:hypothetical protein